MKEALVKLDNEVIKMAGAQKSKSNANVPSILTLFNEEEAGESGYLGRSKMERAVHVILLGFPLKPESAKIRIAKRVVADSRVEVGIYVSEEGTEEYCLVFKTERWANPPMLREREMCGVNPWTAQTVRNLWEGALDPFPAIDAWQKITRILGRARYGYIVR